MTTPIPSAGASESVKENLNPLERHALAVPLPHSPSLAPLPEAMPQGEAREGVVPRKPQLESLLDRFSVERAPPKSLGEKISRVLAPIFEALRTVYQYISQIWGGISRSEEKMRLDLILLHEICGTPVPGAITQLQALSYIQQMLEREKTELRDLSLHRRIHQAIEWMQQIPQLHKTGETTFKQAVQQIQQQIEEANEPLLLPVGFKDTHMLLEIQKQLDDTYSVTLISTSERVREYFDHEHGLDTTKQSIRREIVHVQKNDLLAAIPLLIELQTAKTENSADLFFQVLQFPGSSVLKSPLTERIAPGKSHGSLTETLSYIASQGKEGKKFDLALRLRTFLDLCKDLPSKQKDIRFWKMARTTALQLAHLIEKEKDLLGSTDEQGLELTRIYYELKNVIDALESSPPSSPSLSPLTNVRRVSGKAAFEQEPKCPPLSSLKRSPTTYPEIDPPLVPLDPNQPIVSLRSWTKRLEKCLACRDPIRASREVTLMVRSFPSPTNLFWKEISIQDAKETLSLLALMAKTLQQGVKAKPQASLLDIGSLVALNYYALPLVQIISPQDWKNHLFSAQFILQELLQTHLPLTEKNWLQTIKIAFDVQATPFLKGNLDKEVRSLVDSLEIVAGHPDDSSRLPLPLQAPSYAKALLRESNNAALMEFCPFGCGRDDHYALAAGRYHHDYPTVYLLHNQEAFHPKNLIEEGALHPDEARDLLYLQQTNLHPPAFFDKTGGSSLPLSGHFTEIDHRIQAMNTLALYFEHPHFFKHPSLRWLFESKLFHHEIFSSLLHATSFSFNQPFLQGLFNRLQQEIVLAHKAKDLGLASYLVSLATEMQEIIAESSLSQQQKKSLELAMDPDQLFLNWAKELMGQSDEIAREQQKMLFPLLLSRFFKKLCQNSQDAFFENPQILENIVCMVGLVESNLRGKERIDPELKEQYLTLLQLLSPKIRALVSKDSQFINRVLLCLNPSIAWMQLPWDTQDFPTLLAIDQGGKFYQFDLLTGILHLGKERVEPLPDHIKWHPDVKRLFSQLEGNWQLSGTADGSVIVYTSPTYPNHRILVKEQKDLPGAFQRRSKIIIERQIQGKWHHYVRFKAQNCLEKGQEYPENADLPQQIAVAIGNRSCWVDSTQGRIIVQEEGEKSPSLILSFSSFLLQYPLIEDVFFPDEKTFLLDAKKWDSSHFATIEDPAYLQVRGPLSTPTSVHYTRYEMARNGMPLSYAYQKNQIVSETFPHFVLQPFGVRPGSSDPALGALPLPKAFDQFHLLKQEGKEKVLIPMRRLQPKTTLAGENLPSSEFVYPPSIARLPVFDYTLDPETNRLVATSGEAYAYLTYLALAHWDYEGASFYLNKAQNATGFTENHQTITTWMQELEGSSPHALAIQLRFELLHPKTEEARKIQLLRIASLYERYKCEKGCDPSLALNPVEEEAIQRALQELLKHWGDTQALQPALNRAKPALSLSLPAPDPVDLLGLSRSAKMIWQEGGNEIPSSIRSFRDPNGCLKNFRHLYNRILQLEANSLEFLQLEQYLRMQNHHPSVQSALLKMMCAKKKKELPPALKPLSKIQGPFFNRSKKKALSLAKQVLDVPYLDIYALKASIRANEKAQQLIASKIPEERSLGFDLIEKIDDFDDQNFEENFKNYLLEKLYGKKGKESLEELQQILNTLDALSLDLPQQTIDPFSDQPPLTIRMKYEHLLQKNAALPPFAEENRATLPEREESLSMEKITTPLEKIKPLLPPQWKTHFQIEPLQSLDVDESFFEEIEDPLLQRLATEHRRDLRAYIEERRHVTLTQEAAQTLKKELIAQKTELTSRKAILKRDLLQDVERFQAPAGLLAIRRLIGKGVKPTLETLISLWRRDAIRNLKDLGMKRIPEKELQEMDLRIQSYLEIATKERHLERCIDLTTNCLDSLEDPLLKESLYDALTVCRQFDILDADGRDLLYLEYAQEILLRKQQVSILREMLSDPNAVRQLRMGDGKSKVLLPLLAKRKATGNNLVILMLPEELYETNCRDLDRTNRHLFGQSMFRFDFSRSSDQSERSLERLYDQLLKTVQSKGFVMTTKTSLLSFRNAYLEMLTKLAEASPQEQADLIGKIRVMSRILTLLARQGDVIADEIDACLDVRKEVNYALNESIPFDPLKAAIGNELMQLILTDSDLSELSIAIQSNTQAALSPQRREELLKRLAAIYFEKHPLSGVKGEQFAAYVFNDSEAAFVEEKIFALKERDLDSFRRFACVKAFIDQGFRITLAKVGNVNYGRDPISEKQTIPFKASNTPHIGSEFDEDIEKAAFTMQDYLQNGVSSEQIQQIVSTLRRQAFAEMRQADPSRMLPLSETQAHREFEVFLSLIDPEKKLGSYMSLARMHSKQNIDVLVSLINASPTARLTFCHTQILLKMRQFPAQVHSVATDVADLVCHFSGFTGTPWNLHTYHDKIHAEKNLGVDGSTWAIVLGREIPVSSFAFDPAKPFDSLLDNLPIIGQAQAVIDTGAYLRGTDNSAFIDHCLSKANGQIQAGIYFDASGRIVKKQGDQVLPLELAPVTPLKDNLTLYDQSHTVGADIAQARDALAIVTIGENTFVRDLFQSLWRLRQFHRAQRALLAVSDKIKERILAGQNRPLTKKDILQFCLRNEALRETEDNYRAEKEKIQGLGKRASVHQIAALITNGASDETIVSLSKVAQSKKLFIKIRPQEEAYDQYAKIKREEKPSTLLERYKRQEKHHCEELTQAFHPISPQIAASFQELGQRVSTRSPLPSDWYPLTVKSGQEEGGAVELEAQAETEQQAEISIETETEQEIELVVETIVQQVQNGNGDSGIVFPLVENDVSQAIRGTVFPDKLRRLSDTVVFFDPEIFVSAMFERNLSQTKQTGLSPQMAFYTNRKPVKQVLIAKENSQWTALIPSTHEAHGPCRAYFQTSIPQNTQAVQVCLSATKPLLIHKSGQDRTDALPFTSKEDQAQFYRLYIQVKLFNGEIEYPLEEREALKKWILEKGPKSFKEYFEKNILATKPPRFREAYPKSTLGKVLAELVASSTHP